MRLRVALALGCGLIISVSAPSVWAEPQDPQVCCGDASDCGGKHCCDAESLGMLPCSLEQTGYCMAICIRPGGPQEVR